MLPPQLKLAGISQGMGSTQPLTGNKPPRMRAAPALPTDAPKPPPKPEAPKAPAPGAPGAFKGSSLVPAAPVAGEPQSLFARAGTFAGHAVPLLSLGMMVPQLYGMAKDLLAPKPKPEPVSQNLAVHPGLRPHPPQDRMVVANFGGPVQANPMLDKAKAVAQELAPSALVRRAKDTLDGAGNATLDYLEGQQRPTLTAPHLLHPATTPTI